jgi:peptidoglycan/LPS O-acetylase OafA/YrhL
MKPQGLILLISSVTVALLLWRRHTHPKLGPLRDLLPVAGIALGILIYAVFGNEMAYDVYSLSVCPALVFCLVCRDFGETTTAC